MRFLANENIPFPSIDFLLESGIEIISIAREFPGISDEEVIEIAISTERTIITLDSDYGDLIFRLGYKPAKGVLYFRLKQYQPIEIGEVLLEIIDQKIEFESKLIVVDKNSVRERKY